MPLRRRGLEGRDERREGARGEEGISEVCVSVCVGGGLPPPQENQSTRGQSSQAKEGVQKSGGAFVYWPVKADSGLD